MKFLVFAIIFLVATASYSQEIVNLQKGKSTSLRGLSVVDDKVIWASGSNGWIAKSINGGATWDWQQIKGYEKFDFRDIEAFSGSKALVVNAGSPGVILLTIDGGATWKEMYRNNSAEIFLDGMAFANEQVGFVYGDPINNQIQLLKTTNGGENWQDISPQISEKTLPGEASFAASGTAIRSAGKKIWIATGGAVSRLFYSSDLGSTWQVSQFPVQQGNESSGVFSVAFRNKRGVAVGGDYLQPANSSKNTAISMDRGKSWNLSTGKTNGYRSCVEFINKKNVVACGTTGVDISYDAGNNWANISMEAFNVVGKAKKGNLVIFAGSNGVISQLKF